MDLEYPVPGAQRLFIECRGLLSREQVQYALNQKLGCPVVVLSVDWVPGCGNLVVYEER